MNLPYDLSKCGNEIITLSFPEIFENLVKKSQATTAFILSERTVIYKAFNEIANLPANCVLYISKNVAIVAIGTTRSKEMVIGLKAILKAGKACFPVNLNNRRHSIPQMIDDSGRWCLSTDSATIVPAPGGKRYSTQNDFLSLPLHQYLFKTQTNYNAHFN